MLEGFLKVNGRSFGVLTKVFYEQDTVRVRFHTTDVVSVNENEITLQSNGHRTLTTKRRMNQAAEKFNLGFSVWQRDFVWYVCTPLGDTVEYYNGMVLARNKPAEVYRLLKEPS